MVVAVLPVMVVMMAVVMCQQPGQAPGGRQQRSQAANWPSATGRL